MFLNGEQMHGGSTKNERSISAGNGTIVLGRRYTGRNQDYASVEVDELIFFNKTLKVSEIKALYNNEG